MRRLICFVIGLITVVSLLGTTSVSAAITDDATDGILLWEGYSWTAECLKDEYIGTSYLSNTEPCTHGWLFVDDENCLNFRGVPCGDGKGRFHKIEIPRSKGTSNIQIDWKSSFEVEFEMQIDEFGEGFGLQFYDDQMRVYLVFKEYGVLYHAKDEYHFVNYSLGNEWNKFRCEKKDSWFTLYVNGGALCSYEVPDLKTTGEAAIQFYATSSDYTAAKYKVRNFEVKQNYDALSMTPQNNAKFLVGEDVVLKASVDDGAEYVDYYVGDVAIGRATSSNGYAYTLKNTKAGSYNVHAVTSTGKYANVRNFCVSEERWAKISCDEEINYGSNASAKIVDAATSAIDHVDYYANGGFSAKAEDAPYEVALSGLPVGTSSVYGRVFLEDGTYIDTDVAFVNVRTKSSGNFEIKSEYDLSYSCTDGRGEVLLSDGFFELSLKHSGEAVEYKTRDGIETYNGGRGDFRVVAASGIADVYRNGQFAFSYCLPHSDNSSGMTFSGVENVLLEGSGVKTEVFKKELTGENAVTAEGINSGLFYSLEFDKKDESDETLIFYDGEYEISLEFKNGIYAKAQVVSEAEVSRQMLSGAVMPGYYRLTVYRGLAQIFCDNRFVGSFRAPRNGHKSTLRRVMSNPNATTFVSVKNTDDIYYFEDKFEGNGERESLDYWYNIYGNTSATVEDGSMNIMGDGVFLFDATAEHPDFQWTMTPKLSETTTESGDYGCEGGASSTTVRSGKFAIGVRYRTERDNIKIKYDHSSGQWTLAETTGGSEKILSSKNLILENNVAKKCRLTLKDNELTFVCGGETVFSAVTLGILGNGKFGFMPDGESVLTIDDFSYSGNGKVNAGVNYSLWTEKQFAGTIDFFPASSDGAVGALKNGQYYSTNDNGESWQGPFDASFKGSHTLALKSGRLLTAEDWGGQSHMYLYDSDGNTIFANKVVQASDDKVGDRCALGGRLIQARKIWGTSADAAPRVFYVTSQGSETNGVTTVYYSDDEGQTWKQSKTVMDFENMGNFYGGEADIVELPDGRIRVYFRTDRSFLCYVDSYDGGVNFSNEPITSQFMTPSTAFAVERDPDQTHTYYMYWSYDVTTATAQYIQYPRNRVALAVSHDGCESWEYIMEADDRGVDWIGAHCNSSMRVFDGQVYLNFGYLGDKGKFADDLTVAQVIMVIDPQKMTTVKRFANAHYVVPDYFSVYDVSYRQDVISKNGGVSLLGGVQVSNVAVRDGMVDTAVLARCMGTELLNTDNGVKLVVGDGVVEFVKGTEEYVVNGEHITADEICLTEDCLFLNPRICADIFGKTCTETNDVIMILSGAFSDRFTKELQQLVTGVSEEIEKCIERFKTIQSVEDMKSFFEDYKVILNLEGDFSDASYANMYELYIGYDMALITDYESMMDVIGELTYTEKGRIGEFLEKLNEASAEKDSNTIMLLLTQEYADLISVPFDISELSNLDAVFGKMTGLQYNTIDEVESLYTSAYRAQYNLETGKGNAIAISTVSREFEGWNGLSSDIVGGYSISKINGENVVTLSAYEGRKKEGKTSVEGSVDGVVYNEPGTFGSNITQTGTSVDSESGTVVFDGKSSNFTITGDSAAYSYTMSVVFNMKKPENSLKGTFSTGAKKVSIDFDKEKTSMGVLPQKLIDAESITYRVDISMDTAVLYAKDSLESDCEYVRIGEKSTTSVSNGKWSLKFETQNGVSEISEIGVYSALSSIALDMGGMELKDELYYSSKGGEGHSMTDLLNSGAVKNNVTVDENGRMVMEKKTITNADGSTTVEKNAEISLERLLEGGFDRGELDIRVSADKGSRLYLYFADNSGFRYATSDFTPGKINEKSTGYSFSWETGKFYDIKIITDVAEYDENGQVRTLASVYVKKAEDSKWICVAHNKILTNGSKVGREKIQVTFLNISADKKIVFDEIKFKTYRREAGNYEFVNTTVSMPIVDYVYSFDYMRMDNDTPTQLTIGGEDYGQQFVIEGSRIYSNTAISLNADMNIEEDKNYRFFGKVTITEEKPYVHDSSKIFKNTISMYVQDEEGNVTTVFEDLPMLKATGYNGIRFSMNDTDFAGIRLKNIRVYNGKVLDFVSGTVNGQTATVAVDVLNDDTAMNEDFVVLTGVYNGNVMSGVQSIQVVDDVEGYEHKRIDFSKINHKGAENPVFRVFMWQDTESFVPLTDVAVGSYTSH